MPKSFVVLYECCYSKKWGQCWQRWPQHLSRWNRQSASLLYDYISQVTVAAGYGNWKQQVLVKRQDLVTQNTNPFSGSPKLYCFVINSTLSSTVFVSHSWFNPDLEVLHHKCTQTTRDNKLIVMNLPKWSRLRRRDDDAVLLRQHQTRHFKFWNYNFLIHFRSIHTFTKMIARRRKTLAFSVAQEQQPLPARRAPPPGGHRAPPRRCTPAFVAHGTPHLFSK